MGEHSTHSIGYRPENLRFFEKFTALKRREKNKVFTKPGEKKIDAADLSTNFCAMAFS